MICISSRYVVVVQTEGGSNQTTLCLALPEVIQTGCDGLQRILAGKFYSQVCLAETFVQICNAGHHFTGLNSARGRDVLVYVIRVVRLDRSIDSFPERQVSDVRRAAGNLGSIRSWSQNSGVEKRGFLYRVFRHIGRQYRDIASYDVTNSGDCHYLFPQGFKLPFKFGRV
ncbi:putative helicase [Salmonella phage fmb-p1]|uniref:Putative helicase n=1 Tax=Salmonella phage fmb-p1 TaxID=2849081 RepID=A0A8F2FA47_9CAUD|nr:putative helicase [Salmonella phage fmb-p1]QWT71886.1 putative helicase [Salmonella phage fmb-p1]